MTIIGHFDIPAFINKVLVIELRDLWMPLSVPLSLLLLPFWADWSSSICWWISIRNLKKWWNFKLKINN
jgi:hypothetical protein